MKPFSRRSSSSPPPPPPYAFPPRRWEHEVFLSFRGEDTRTTFTDHLYAALVRAGVWTFRDAEELRIGESIAEQLVGTIQRCRISLIVFSENYACSRWCLQELVEIMECRRTHRQVVFPIFYHVDPSHVRKQKGSFGKAFLRHEAAEVSTQVTRWRAALGEAASLAGFDIADKNIARVKETSIFGIEMVNWSMVRMTVQLWSKNVDPEFRQTTIIGGTNGGSPPLSVVPYLFRPYSWRIKKEE